MVDSGIHYGVRCPLSLSGSLRHSCQRLTGRGPPFSKRVDFGNAHAKAHFRDRVLLVAFERQAWRAAHRECSAHGQPEQRLRDALPLPKWVLA